MIKTCSFQILAQSNLPPETEVNKKYLLHLQYIPYPLEMKRKIVFQ